MPADLSMTFERLATLVSLAVGLQVLMSVGITLFYRYSRNQNKLDLAELRMAIAASQAVVQSSLAAIQSEILDRIDKKLDNYVRDQRFRDYVESHAKEHTRIEEFMTRHRDWKHIVEPWARGVDMHIDDLQKDAAKLEAKLSGLENTE